MINRRTFLRNSGALALGSMLAQQASGMTMFHAAKTPPPGLQLYTVMTSIEEDLDGTLKKIAAIGYKELESAFSRKGGFYGMKPKEFAAKAKEYGLKWTAHHIGGAPRKGPPRTGADGKPIVMPPMLNLKDNYQEAVDAAAEGGLSYLVCSSTALETLDEVKEAIEVFNKTGEACEKAKIGFAYHNHTREFESIEGQTPFDMFTSQISADLMKMELDLAWATKAGMDPVALFKKHPGRFPLWHVKDINTEQKPVEVGAGTIDFKRIFAEAKTAGLEHFFVEQDQAPQPLDNIATSFANLKKIQS